MGHAQSLEGQSRGRHGERDGWRDEEGEETDPVTHLHETGAWGVSAKVYTLDVILYINDQSKRKREIKG